MDIINHGNTGVIILYGSRLFDKIMLKYNLYHKPCITSESTYDTSLGTSKVELKVRLKYDSEVITKLADFSILGFSKLDGYSISGNGVSLIENFVEAQTLFIGISKLDEESYKIRGALPERVSEADSTLLESEVKSVMSFPNKIVYNSYGKGNYPKTSMYSLKVIRDEYDTTIGFLFKELN